MRTSPVNKGLAIVLSLLVPVLLLVAFILSVVGTAGSGWTWRVELEDGTKECKGFNHRGPFQYCVLELKPTTTPSSTASTSLDSTATATATATDSSSSSTAMPSCPTSAADSRYVQNCTTINSPTNVCPSRPKDITSFGLDESTHDSDHFCQQLEISANLLIAGCALIGIGMVASFGLSAVSLLQLFGLYKAPDDTSSPSIGAVSLGTSVITGLGFLAMLFGTVIAANDLVNLQFPIGDWYSDGDFATDSLVGPWMIGKSVGIATGGWVCALVGATLISKIWPGPTAYYQRVIQKDNYDVNRGVVESRGKDDGD